MFSNTSALNQHERTHQKPRFLCEVPKCKYVGSHTHYELVEHLRRVHPHISAVYTKGKPIPWNAPKLQLAVSKPAKDHQTIPSPVSIQAFEHSKDKDEISDVDTKKELEEEEMTQGFTNDIKGYVRDYNDYIKRHYTDLSIHTPIGRSVSSPNFVDGVRMCSGTKHHPCPYEVPINEETACLVPQDRTAADGKTMDKFLILRSRCLLCTRASNRSEFKIRLQKEENGVLICSQTANCTNPRLPGRLQCQQCADAWNKKALEREMERRILRPIKFGLGSQVTNSQTMVRSLSGIQTSGLDEAWTGLRDRIRRKPNDIFIVDTETGYLGLRDVHQVGVTCYDGSIILDVLVDHGCTIKDYFDQARREVQDRLQIRAYKAIRKTYGPPSAAPMPGISPRDVFMRLKMAGLTRTSLWIEHSVGHFDYNHLKAIAPPDLIDILPDPKNVFSTLALWREIMPGLFSHKLSHIYSLLKPGDPLIDRRHSAVPDALMCLCLLKMVLGKES